MFILKCVIIGNAKRLGSKKNVYIYTYKKEIIIIMIIIIIIIIIIIYKSVLCSWVCESV